MKRIICFIPILISFILVLSACINQKSTETPDSASKATTVSIEEIQAQLSELKGKSSNIMKMYDNSINSSIDTYCEEYLSYYGSTTNNINKIQSIVTESFYSELLTHTGHQKSDNTYEQSTGVENLYYSDYSSPTNTINIMAHCKQTVIFNNEVTTSDVGYSFGMVYENNTWKINSVDRIF